MNEEYLAEKNRTTLSANNLFLVRNFNLLYIRVVTTAVTITPRMNPPNNVPSITPMLVSFGNISKL